jgi:hypothetical protein
VGSRAQVANLIVRLVRSGIRHIILDAPPSEREVAEIDLAARDAARQLQTHLHATVA